MHLQHASQQRLSRYKEVRQSSASRSSRYNTTTDLNAGYTPVRLTGTVVRPGASLGVLQDTKADPVIRTVAGEHVSVWCVCDGHHGKGAAMFVARECANELLHRLEEHPRCPPSEGTPPLPAQNVIFMHATKPVARFE